MPINKETIISVFTEKLTLEQWLKTINKALDEAVLTGVEIAKKGNATLSFKFTFEDGTFLESNDLVLQQGESVQSAYIQDGHLYLTLTNGTNLDAGNIKPVSNFSINDSQHLIVNYQDGTSQDLGAIFDGNVNISGTLNANAITSPSVVATYVEAVTLKATDNAQVFEKIVDKDLHYRFVEGDGVINALTGFTSVFCKWSLSGSHIMFVLAGTFSEGAEVPSVHDIASFTLPSWVYNKIYPVWSTYLENKVVSCKATNWSSQEVDMALMKESGVMKIRLLGAPTTFTATRSFRVQFDLIIDNA